MAARDAHSARRTRKRAEVEAPSEIERWPQAVRRFHTVTYLVTALAALTGLWLMTGHEGEPSLVARLVGRPDVEIHVWLGWALVGVFVIGLVLARRSIGTFVRDSLEFGPGDLTWLRRWPGAAFTGRFERHDGHYDPGQRIANLAIVACLFALVASGIGLVFLHGGPVFAVLATIHRWATILFVPLIIGHVLIASGMLPGYRGAWRAMHLGGRLHLDTARRLWPGWTDSRLGRLRADAGQQERGAHRDPPSNPAAQ